MSAASSYFDHLHSARGRREGVSNCFALPEGIRKSINQLRNRAARRKANMQLAKELPQPEDFIMLIEPAPEQAQRAVTVQPNELAEYLHGTKHLAKRIRRQLSSR